MVFINNLTTVNVVEELFLRKVARKVLKGENKELADLSIALVGRRRIRELNKRYRGKNRATDVLAFSENCKHKDLGEIIICLREVKENAKKYKSTFREELARVLIHGILHLLGYEHEKTAAKNKDKMMKKEEYYLLQLGF